MKNIKNSLPVVMGLGNPLFQDEGLGIHVINQLMASDLGARAELIDGGTDGLSLLGTVEAARHLLVIDAIDGGFQPGTIKKLQDHEISLFARAKLSVHQLGFQEVLALARLRGRYPEQIVLIGVQPRTLEWGISLSSEVSRAVPQIITMVYKQIDSWAGQARNVV